MSCTCGPKTPKDVIYDLLEEVEDRKEYGRDAWNEAHEILSKLDEAGFVIVQRGY